MTNIENSKSGAAEASQGWRPKVVDFSTAQPPAPAPSVAPEAPSESLSTPDPLFEALLSASPDLVFNVRRGGEVIDFRAPNDNEFLLTAEVVVGRRLMDLLPPQAGQMATHYLEKTLRTRQPQVFAHQYVLPGRIRIFEVRTAVSGPSTVLAVVRDITDRNLLEKEVVETSNRLQMRIGQDLHDGLGQHLAGITFLTKALERKLEALHLAEAAEVGEITRLVMEALTQTRNLARGMFPSEVEARGLITGLRELATAFEERCQIACTLEADEEPELRDPGAALHLFRIAQEAVNNAVTHGKARRVQIRLHAEGELWHLSITDDGVGISSHRHESSGLGLRIMRYRAQRVGGELRAEPNPTGGTTVLCTFPRDITEV